MKITLKQLLESQQALASLCNKPWPSSHIKASYGLGKLWRGAVKEIEAFNEERDKQIQLMGEPMPNAPGQKQLKPENYGAFDEAMKELLAEETAELWEVKLTVEMVEAAGIAFAPSEFAALDWLITEENNA